MLKKLNYPFMHSHFKFGLSILSALPKSNLLKVQSIQSKAIRILAEAVRHEHAHALYVNLNNYLNSIPLILYAVAKFMHKRYQKCLPSSFNNYFILFHPLWHLAIPEMP